ncbi:Fe-S cluster biogenesis protein NfuA/nitrite reductase/ring-hydroxylating ferredoxin subunit [Mycobacterium frederiksbergense]|uniref:Fe-S cluster biogenesis protein NfuA/nitrite reductase/ring-hydroxylating ferredoxin subunit n=1 Tax=Mycolicibacterium frederiksbergense TaxID=117567 RepID=A0ABT6KUD1_9MYCO|nr:NifU family protein [Mycolicibacterium frederiksbergense]MDH6193490.1 Fe-S cluster biogenesis protein NfuA/nitrite reductase/ring-hydroxylating ferredoxin subunit [Mycolicibacterium frederiksbergense]
MPPVPTPIPDNPEDDTRWRAAGERIQALLDASAAGGPGALQNAEQLVRELTDLYGAALGRLLRIASDSSPELAQVVSEAVAADDLVASLLLVHGLHPHSVQRRVADALDGVRPYLGSHGGDVDLIEVDGTTARLRFTGTCKSCPSSAATLELAIKDAVMAAAPEITSIDVVTDMPEPDLIPAASLLDRVHPNGHRHSSWQPAPVLDELAPGEVGGFAVAGAAVLACRIGAELFVYRDRCPNCARGLAGARLTGTVLQCPHCGSGFDVVHAGIAADDPSGSHLEPIPVLVRAGVRSIALAEEVAS